MPDESGWFDRGQRDPFYCRYIGRPAKVRYEAVRRVAMGLAHYTYYTTRHTHISSSLVSDWCRFWALVYIAVTAFTIGWLDAE